MITFNITLSIKVKSKNMRCTFYNFQHLFWPALNTVIKILAVVNLMIEDKGKQQILETQYS